MSPAGNVVYFLAQLFQSSNENGDRPEIFDVAFLLDRYRSEFGMLEIPQFLQKAVFPIVLWVGRIMGKYDKFKDAPPSM
jgi:hypothetical protein